MRRNDDIKFGLRISNFRISIQCSGPIFCILYKIMGLCGNFNGDTEDDMTTSEGDVSHDTVQFVSSWKTNAACTSNAITDSLGACAQSTDYMTYARNLCTKLRDGAKLWITFVSFWNVASNKPYKLQNWFWIWLLQIPSIDVAQMLIPLSS